VLSLSTFEALTSSNNGNLDSKKHGRPQEMAAAKCIKRKRVRGNEQEREREREREKAKKDTLH
jgi:hypothetical protein